MPVLEIYRLITKSLLLSILIISLFSCEGCRKNREQEGVASDSLHDLQKVIETGILKVAMDYNSTDYFVYRGKPMGYQYELIVALCEDLGVKPYITVRNNLMETFEGLKSGEFDLVAKNLTISHARRLEVDFTKPLKYTRQVIVQRRPSMGKPDSLFVTRTPELAGKTIHVQQNTSYYWRLVQLSQEIGHPIKIVEDSVSGVEKLVAMVAAGEIDYTVCDENVALLNRLYYPNLDVSLRISFPQNIAWAVRKGSAEWREYLNNWIEQFQQTGEYKEIYGRYFINSGIAGRITSEYHSIFGGKISMFDPLVRELSEKHGWDWRLISSIIFHESRFDPEAESWGGAVGLMQLMPNTAESLGVEDIYDPRQNIEGGILFLNWLDQQFVTSIPDSVERIKFVLAAYNIGLGPVNDARKLAIKYGKESHVWDNNVDYYLTNKSLENNYKDSVVSGGSIRGEEAYNFVARVTGNYQHYLNLIPE